MVEERVFVKSPEVVVVEASAGSGKTYELAKRFVSILLNLPSQKENNSYLYCNTLRTILAITFTNKATVEMKGRILELLKKIALNSFSSPDEEEDILSLVKGDKSAIRERAMHATDWLIHNYNFFQVQTIDSFINTLLLGSALNIDRSSNFQIKRDYTKYISYCLDKVIDEAVDNEDVHFLLEELLEHYLFVENRTSWFPRKDILSLMMYFFSLMNTYGRNFRCPQRHSSEIIKKKKSLFKEISLLAKSLPEGINGNFRRALGNFLEREDSVFDISALPDRFGRKDVPMNKSSSVPFEFKRKWEMISRKTQELVEMEAHLVYAPYVKLFRRVMDFLEVLTKQEDIVFLGELNRKTRLLFDRGLTVPELYYRMATRFRHYLIDEFQDTSLLQWSNLYGLIEEALSTGGTFFYVGDRKQAIYRFRGGEARLFDEVKESFCHYNVISRRLHKNWRSQKEIVMFNNDIFSFSNLADAISRMPFPEDIAHNPSSFEEVFAIYKDAQQEYRPEYDAGYVDIERLEVTDKQKYYQTVRPKIIGLIDDIHTTRGFPLREIALLCRDNAEVELISSWFLEEGIPVESEKTMNIKKNPLISELISFLKFLHSPIDDTSFAFFIMGDIFSAATGISKEQMRDFLFRIHSKEARTSPLYTLFRKQYPSVWEKFFSPFFRSVGFVAPYELVVSIYERFFIERRFLHDGAFFMKLLELIKEQEEDYPGLADFLNYLDVAPEEDLYVDAGAEDAMRVMTIHKSKGLEFDVVIIPSLRMDIRPSMGGGNLPSYLEEAEDESFYLVRITRDYRKYSPRLKHIYNVSYIKAFIDELNNIYVAFTRPRYELYVFLPKRIGNQLNRAWFLIPDDIHRRGKKVRCYKKSKEGGLVKTLSPPRYRDWVSFLREEFVDATNLQNLERIKEGEIIHYILSFLPEMSNRDISKVIEEACSAARLKYKCWKDFGVVHDKVKRILAHGEFRKFFITPGAFVYREKEVVDSKGGVRRIDRLIILDKEAWVIDFKTGVEFLEDYRGQVREYMEIVKKLYPDRIVKGFLLYTDRFSVEEVLL